MELYHFSDWLHCGSLFVSYVSAMEGAVDLPKDIQPNRRLLDPRDLPVPGLWMSMICCGSA